MSTTAEFGDAHVEVTPGVAVNVPLVVANGGSTVEAYTFEPVGDLAPHTQVSPAELALYPGTDGTVTVRITVPEHGGVPAGDADFAVVVRPRDRAGEVTVPEATVTVLPVFALEAELTPRTSQARLWSRHSLAVDNRGNRPVYLRITGHDPDGRLAVRGRPEYLTIPPAEARFATIRLRVRGISWRGQPVTRPFEVTIDPEDDTPVVLPGQVVQEPVLPRGTGKLLAVLAAAAVALVALWFAVLRPVISSTAQEAAKQAVREPLQQVREQADKAQQQAERATDQAGLSSQKSQQAEQTVKKALRGQQVAGSSAVRPLNRRLVVLAAPGQDATQEFVVPAGQVVSVTDLVFESRGDTGSVQLLRDDDVLITAQTEDFRTLDQHFVSPISYTAGDRIIFRLACAEPVRELPQCQAALYLSGEQQPKPRPQRQTPSPQTGTPADRPRGN